MGEMKVKKVLFSGGLLNTRISVVEKEVAGLKEIISRHIFEGIKKRGAR